MIRIRVFEERCAELYAESKIRGFLHLYIGEEAVAAGVMSCLQPADGVLATYREHGHALLRGVSAESIMSEMFGKATGCSGGRGGSMHLFDKATRFFGGNAIVGGHLPLAVGLGLADRMLGRNGAVTVCFFGEGAMAEGEFHEAMNLAALWNVPVLFCCENNRYAMGTSLKSSESQVDLALKAASYALPAWVVDGMDVMEVHRATTKALAALRAGGGPMFIEFQTYRFRAHSMFDPDLYRDPAEVERWKQRDPITTFADRLLADGVIDDSDVDAMWTAARNETEAAVAAADAAPIESVDTLLDHVTRPVEPTHVPRDPGSSGPRGSQRPGLGEPRRRGRGVAVSEPTTMTYREAMREALRDALASDDRVFIMGEDVADYGGTYAVTKGLYEEFGRDRVRNTPLSESGFVGAGIGAALGGMRPIVEIMTVNFSLLALDQLVNTAATLLHMSGGQFNVPLVVRTTTGAGRQLAAQHSHSLEGWFAHVPGLKVIAPATPADARWMLPTALADPNPVIIFEHSGLYNDRGPVDPESGPVDIDRAVVRRRGDDLTIVAWAGMVPKALDAADELAAAGVSAEVIDLRSLRPLDLPTIAESVQRTHRALVVDEGWRTGGLNAELAASITERCFWTLDAPVGRVAGLEVPIPYAKHLETAAIPQVADIAAAATALVGASP